MDSEFEKKLRAQPAKEIPGEWRAEILSAARAAQPSASASGVPHRSWLSTINQQLSTLLWPNQKAWGALAAVWVVIFLLNHAAQDGDGVVVAKKSGPPSPEMIAEMKKQQKLYAELVGAGATADVEHPRDLPNRPRTWRVEVIAV